MDDVTTNDNQQDPLDAEFEALLDSYLPESKTQGRGELVDATVVGIVDDLVLVSGGGKEESGIPISEFQGPRGEVSVKPGDMIRVLIEGYSRDGVPQMSYSKARGVVAQKMLEEAFTKRVPVPGVVQAVVKGGLLVDVGRQAFMPASQADIFRLGDLNALVGQEIEAYVVDYDSRTGRAVLSRRQLLEERKELREKEFFASANAGDVVKGIVKDVLDFGVFVRIGEIEGLIPRSELTYDRGTHPSDVVKPGEAIEVKILDVSRETGKLTLSRKRLGQDPWDSIEERFPIGTPVAGKVVSIQNFGAFVQLEEGLTGLVRPSDISWEAERISPEQYFRMGDTVTCQVIEIDKVGRKLGLGLKHLTRDPWTNIEEKYPIGSRQKGTVVSIRDFGAFVRLDEYTEGLLHISDLSWGVRHKHPSEAVQEGQEIEVVVLKLDREQRRISLGLKQITLSPLAQFRKDHPIGSRVSGKITRLMPFGAFVEIAEGLEGLIHISQLDEARVDSPERVVRVGEEITAKILAIDLEKERVSLSRKEALRDAEKENIRQYMAKEGGKEKALGGGFADLLSAALKKKS